MITKLILDYFLQCSIVVLVLIFNTNVCQLITPTGGYSSNYHVQGTKVALPLLPVHVTSPKTKKSLRTIAFFYYYGKSIYFDALNC